MHAKKLRKPDSFKLLKNKHKLEKKEKRASDVLDSKNATPNAKRRKIDNTQVNSTEHSEATTSVKDAMEHVSKLFKPECWAAFIHNYWSISSPMFIRGNGEETQVKPESRVGFACGDFDQLCNSLMINSTALPYRFRTDVHVARYDPVDDDIEDATPVEPTIANKQEISQYCSEGFGMAIFHAELRSKPVARLVKNLDTIWNGEGSITTMIQITPPGVAPFAAHSHQCARLLVQLYGKQRVQLFYPRDMNEIPVDDEGNPAAFPYHMRGHFPLVIHQVDFLVLPQEGQSVPEGTPASLAFDAEVAAGDVLFIPENYIVFSEPAENEDKVGSATLELILSHQTSASEIISLAVERARRECTDGQRSPASILLENSVELTAKAALDATTMLSQALSQHLQPIIKLFQIRSSYHTDHFAIHEWLTSKYGDGKLEQELDKAGGLLRIRNFLPTEVAQRILETIQNIKDEEWLVTAAYDDPGHNNIAHKFYSAKLFPNADTIFSLFKSVLPQYESSFSAAKYTRNHFIDPHDDRAYKEIGGRTYSRHIALIYYLNPEWEWENGGLLVDMEDDNERYAPEFNSCIVFRVPRWHRVQTILTNTKRLSIFGWFLKPGKLYDLYTGEPPTRQIHVNDTEESDEVSE